MKFIQWALFSFGLVSFTALAQTGAANNPKPGSLSVVDADQPPRGSTYVPIDSWIYPALDRLQALGYINYAYRGLRPWTRSSITHLLNQTAEFQDFTANDDEAYQIYLALRKELNIPQLTWADFAIRATALTVPTLVSEAFQGLH